MLLLIVQLVKFSSLYSVISAKQRALVEKIYGKVNGHFWWVLKHSTITGQELKAYHYEPPQPKPMVRPAYMKFIPSPAGESALLYLS